MLEVSEGGLAVLTGVAVGVALPLDLRRSFSAFSISISFCPFKKKQDPIKTAFTDSGNTGNSHFPAFRLGTVVILNQYYWNHGL